MKKPAGKIIEGKIIEGHVRLRSPSTNRSLATTRANGETVPMILPSMILPFSLITHHAPRTTYYE
jgi:hypothetical protein